MAFYETRTVQVANNPSVIDNVTREAALFMWQVQNQQVTDRKDTHTEHRSDAYAIYETVVTESANYCTITLQRDKQIPHYNEIVNLEQQLAKYRSLKDSQYDGSLKWPIILFLIIVAVAAILEGSVSVLLGEIIGILGIAFLVWRIVVYFKERKEFTEYRDTSLAAMESESQLLAEARELSSQILQEMK